MRGQAVLSGLLCGAGLIGTAHAQAPAPDASTTRPEPSAPQAAEQVFAIALLENPEQRALIARLRAELDDLGFRVEEVPPDENPDTLEVLADGTRVLALVRIDETAQAIEFYIHAPATSDVLHDRVPIRPRRADVAAVATVELLRARLIKLGILQPAPQPVEPLPPAPLPPPPPPPPPRDPSLTADVNAGAWYSAGGLGASPALVLGARAHPKNWLAVGAFGAFEPQSSELSATEGSVRSHAMLLGVLTDFGFSTGRTHFELGGGVALSVLSLSGEAGSPYAGRVTHSYGVAPVTRFNLGFRLAGPVSLHTEMISGVSSPRIAVRFAERTVAHWGRPFVLGLVGLEVGF